MRLMFPICAMLIALSASGAQATNLEPHFYYKLQTGNRTMTRTAYESAAEAFAAFKAWQLLIQDDEGSPAGLVPLDIYPTPVADYYNGMPKAYSFRFTRLEDCPKTCDGSLLISMEMECPAHSALQLVALTRKSFSVSCGMPDNKPGKPPTLSCDKAKGHLCQLEAGCYPGTGATTGNSYCFPFLGAEKVKASTSAGRK